MCSKILTTISTENYWSDIRRLKALLEDADAIVIGAGAGLSTSAGHSYTGERFLKYFADFHEAYGIRDMYSGGFYPFRTLEENGPGGADRFIVIVMKTEQGNLIPICCS